MGALVVVIVALQPLVPALAATTLVLDPSWGPTGQRVVVTGEDYFAGSEVRVYFDTTTPEASRRVAITEADDTGAISTEFIVPGALVGDKNVLACSVFPGEDRCQPAIEPGVPDPQTSATFGHLGFPSIRLDPGAAQAGRTVRIEGERFSSQGCGDVEVIFDFGGSDEQVVATPTLFSGGPGTAATFTADFSVPDRLAGSYAVVAQQTSAGCRITPRTSLDVLEFEVTPDSGAAGSTATATGAGFPDAEECGPTVLRFDGEVVAEIDTVGFPGDQFSVEFEVPDRPPATYLVVATQDGCGDRRATDTFEIPSAATETETPTETPTQPPTEPPTETPTEPPTETPTETETPRPDASLTIDPAEGPIETEAEAVGDGFDDQVPVEVRFGEADATTVAPGEVVDGGFTVSVVVPEGVPGGPTTVTACQRCGAPDERAATTTFLVTPRLVVVPDVGTPGFVTLAQGDGFPATTAVTLDWQPGLGARVATTDAAGVLATPVLVFHRDLLGPRELTATVPDQDPVTAPFLVVPGSSQLRDFSFRR